MFVVKTRSARLALGRSLLQRPVPQPACLPAPRAALLGRALPVQAPRAAGSLVGARTGCAFCQENLCELAHVNTQPRTHPSHFQNVLVMLMSGCPPISDRRISLYKKILICINQTQLLLHLLEKLDPPLSLACPT